MIADVLARLPELVNGNAPLVRRGRFLDVTFMVEVDGAPFYVTVRKGRIDAVEQGPALLRPWAFAVRASAEAWSKHWQTHPAPGWHDIFAMAKIGEAVIEGDLLPLMANLRYVKEVLAAPRPLEASGRAA
jgi:hypothetical protein